MTRRRYVLGLGSNVGDRRATLRAAVHRLRALAAPAERFALSPLYESEAMLPPGLSPERARAWSLPFLNLAVSLACDLGPDELLERAKKIEAELGRRDRERWAPREVDVDLLVDVTGPWRSETPRPLVLPHAGLLERPFALLPLADVEPDWMLAEGRTARELARQWRAGGASFGTRRSLLSLTALMGVVNVTPDSFSDGGKFYGAEAALAQARGLVADGAEIVDLGAESTRPGATPVAPDEEWRRLEPVLAGLPAELRVSLDTRHAETAARALRTGRVAWLNDVEGFESAAMREAAAASDASLVMMHSLGVPPSRDRVIPSDRDPVEVVLEWAERRAEELGRLGIARSRLILDPGIGFGKTAAHSLELLRGTDRLLASGFRLLIGHSRKSFLAGIAPEGPASLRDSETAFLSGRLAEQGVDYLRVHDVALSARALRLGAAVGGRA